MQDNSISYSLFQRFPHLIEFTSTCMDGAMKKDDKIQKKNVDRFLNTHNIPPEKLVLVEQAHGSQVAVVDNLEEQFIAGADGIVTTQKNIYLGIVTADCMPVMFYEEKKHIIGIAHAGYKGLLQGIIENMVEVINKLGGDSKMLNIGVGPSIGVCCYSVDRVRIELFKKKFPLQNDTFQVREDIFYLDLKKTCTIKLMQCGIGQENIEVSPFCTNHNELFFSYRREGKTFGEFISVIGMK